MPGKKGPPSIFHTFADMSVIRIADDQVSSMLALFREWSGEEAVSIVHLPESGSERKYFRLEGSEKHAIGVYHPVQEETAAFLSFSAHFRHAGLNVPQVYGIDSTAETYLIEDLGNLSLFSLINSQEEFGGQPFRQLQKSLAALIRFQAVAGKTLDYSVCYPRSAFDAQSVMWDLNYFKYNFLKLHLLFHEQKLEDDFQRLTGFLLKAPGEYFMYRDFQSRNILIRDDEPWFIDYQGGRRGPLPYDVASLLFQVRARIPDDYREKLESHYCGELSGLGIDPDLEFRPYYHGFILIRLLQVLGAYGFRGLIQKRSHFLESIPFAIDRLQWWVSHSSLPVEIPELRKALEKLAATTKYPDIESAGKAGPLTVDLYSFSYRDGIPPDYSGHGGGFVFDCRSLPNPGREERYRTFTGKDPVIIQYLGHYPEINAFIDDASGLVERAISAYLEKGYTKLSVAFGCTGGQHRSVYCAEKMAVRLAARFPAIRVRLRHRELERLNDTAK